MINKLRKLTEEPVKAREIIRGVLAKELRQLAKKDERTTEFGSARPTRLLGKMSSLR